jgi:hypothetical protein
MIKLVGFGAFFAAPHAAKNRAIRSNFCPSGAKIPLLSLALRRALRSPAKKNHNSNAVAILGACYKGKKSPIRRFLKILCVKRNKLLASFFYSYIFFAA